MGSPRAWSVEAIVPARNDIAAGPAGPAEQADRTVGQDVHPGRVAGARCWHTSAPWPVAGAFRPDSTHDIIGRVPSPT